MGKIGKVGILTVMLAAAALMAGSWSFAGELIEPTRTLGGPEKPWGSLNVFSEPPRMDVYLDGEKVGATPLWLRQVEAGPHKLKVEESEKDVQVEKGKAARIGLFKGSFVTFSAVKEEKAASEAPKEEPPQTSLATPTTEEQTSRDLSLWERYVNGSLKHF
jgi:PEGA domain